MQELREAISAFTDVKPSLAWAETFPGTLSYYLASAFGEVWMQPSGTVGLVGFATNALFLRDALDKAGIEAQFVARGEYKSAANLFTQDRYTEAHREADTRLVESLHAQVWQGVAEVARAGDAPQLDALADRAPLLRDDAVGGGLVDRIGFRDEAYRRIAELSGAEDSRRRDADDRPGAAAAVPVPVRADPPEQARRACPGARKPTIAVVTRGRADRQRPRRPAGCPAVARSSAGGDTIAAALREAAADDDVKAVVVRVESPGGSVNGSETIWREVCRIREAGKPVVASMGAVAASGGYYVSMSADAIVASPGTITGSIGVVTGKLVARELKERLGVGSDKCAHQRQCRRMVGELSRSPPSSTPMVEAEADLFYTISSSGSPRPGHVGRGRRCGGPRSGVDRGRRAWNAGWSTNSAAFARRSRAPRCWPGSRLTPRYGWPAIPGRR